MNQSHQLNSIQLSPKNYIKEATTEAGQSNSNCQSITFDIKQNETVNQKALSWLSSKGIKIGLPESIVQGFQVFQKQNVCKSTCLKIQQADAFAPRCITNSNIFLRRQNSIRTKEISQK